MSTVEVRVDRRRASRPRTRIALRFAALAMATAFVLVACSGSGDTPNGDDANAPTGGATASARADAEALELARSFVEAYGASDVQKATSYLADDAEVSGIGGKRFPKLVSWFEAMGYEQRLDSCAVIGSSEVGTYVRCSYDFNSLRSEELGTGPFGGSFFDLTVKDGAIVAASDSLNFEDEFSPQVWEPFAEWVSQTYPKDARVMYTDGTHSMGRLTPKSFRLWEQHSREYAKEMAS